MDALGNASRALFRYTHGRERAAREGDDGSTWSLAASTALNSAATVEQQQPSPSVEAILTSANDYCSMLVSALA